MTLFLKREESREDGIFSVLDDASGKVLFYTLEHSYAGNPKLYSGTFKCIRGMHRLEGMTHSFETFEITGVTGHSNILFHAGNWNKDSSGCVLLGLGIAQSPQGQMITGSKQAFAEFIELTKSLDTFYLVIS
jgi:hypothetical protein